MRHGTARPGAWILHPGRSGFALDANATLSRAANQTQKSRTRKEPTRPRKEGSKARQNPESKISAVGAGVRVLDSTFIEIPRKLAPAARYGIDIRICSREIARRDDVQNKDDQ